MEFTGPDICKRTCAHTHKHTNAGDGSVLLMPLAAHTEAEHSKKAHGKDSGLLRFDLGVCVCVCVSVCVCV